MFSISQSTRLEEKIEDVSVFQKKPKGLVIISLRDIINTISRDWNSLINNSVYLENNSQLLKQKFYTKFYNNKFENLCELVAGIVEILSIAETNLDLLFLNS